MLACILPHVVVFFIGSTAGVLQGSSWQHVRLWLLGLLCETIIVQLVTSISYMNIQLARGSVL